MHDNLPRISVRQTSSKSSDCTLIALLFKLVSQLIIIIIIIKILTWPK